MMKFAQRLDRIETSAIRELFKLLGKPGIISFAGGFPDAAMFDVEGIRKASQVALSEQAGEALQYGATEGHQSLREEIARHMSSKGVTDLKPTDLIITTGSQQALDLIGKTLLEDGDVALVESPTFLATIQCFRLYGPRVMGVPIDADGVRLDLLEEMIVRHRPKLIYIIPNFGNPSGVLLSLQRRLQLLQLVARHRVLLVEDDPYGELYFSTPPPPSLLALSAQVPGSRDHLLYCGSLSKVLSPGLRIGWLIGPPDLLQRASMCKQFSDAHTSTFAQVTAAHYLKSGYLPANLERVRRVYSERASAMGAALQRELAEAFSFTQPQGGLFIWGRLTGAGGRGNDAQKFAHAAITHQVALVPGHPFFADQADRSSLRLSFATSNTERIEEGVKRLGRALHDI